MPSLDCPFHTPQLWVSPITSTKGELCLTPCTEHLDPYIPIPWRPQHFTQPLNPQTVVFTHPTQLRPQDTQILARSSSLLHNKSLPSQHITLFLVTSLSHPVQLAGPTAKVRRRMGVDAQQQVGRCRGAAIQTPPAPASSREGKRVLCLHLMLV